MSIAFATVEDVSSGWRTLDDHESQTAKKLIERASAFILALMNNHGVEMDVADDLQMINIKTVVCNLVRRSIGSSDVDGIASLSQGIGATNASVSFANPDGSFFLTKAEKQALGLTGTRIGNIRAKTYADSCCGWRCCE